MKSWNINKIITFLCNQYHYCDVMVLVAWLLIIHTGVLKQLNDKSENRTGIIWVNVKQLQIWFNQISRSLFLIIVSMKRYKTSLQLYIKFFFQSFTNTFHLLLWIETKWCIGYWKLRSIKWKSWIEFYLRI